MKARRTGSLPVPCNEWAEKLADSASEKLITEDKIALARHLKNCPACASVYAEYRAVDDLILGLPSVKLAEQQIQQLQEQISQQGQSNDTHSFENATQEIPQVQEVPYHPLPQRVQKRRMTRTMSVLAALLIISIITGSFVWFAAIHNPSTAASGSTPVAPNAVLYVTSRDGTIYAIRPQDGKIYWSRQLDPQMGNITVSNGMIFTYTMNRSFTNGFLYALKASNGQQIWKLSLQTIGLPAIGVEDPPPSVYSDGKTIYLGLGSGIYAWRASDGKQLWYHQPPKACNKKNAIACERRVITVAHGIVFAYLNGLYALRASDGQTLWHNDYYPEAPFERVFIIGNKVYAASFNMSLIDVMQADTGQQLRNILLQRGNPIQMAVANNILYVYSGQQDVYAIRSSDDTILWHKQYSDLPHLLGADANNIYFWDSYCGSKPGSPQDTVPICAVNARDGSFHWRWQPSRCSSANTCTGVTYEYSLIMQETIYITVYSANGAKEGLYAVNMNDGKVRWHILTDKIVYSPVVG